MPHRNLLYPGVLKHQQRPEKTVHTGEDGHLARHRRADHLQRTACVLHHVARHLTAETVGNLRLKLLEAGILSVCPYAGDHVVFPGLGKKEVEILRVGLEVGVDISHPFRAREVDAGLHGRAQAVVAAEGYVVEIPVAAAYAAHQGQAVVGGAVVNHKHARPFEAVGQKSPEPLLDLLHVVSLVIYWHYYRKLIFRCLVHHCFITISFRASSPRPLWL